MISNYFANKILDTMCGVSDSFSIPDTVYLGLSSTEPDASTGDVTGEPTEASYARIAIGGLNKNSKFGSANYGKITNKEEIQFKTARTAWGQMYYFFLSAGATPGINNAFLWGDIKDGEGVFVGELTVPTFYEGDLVISLDVPL